MSDKAQSKDVTNEATISLDMYTDMVQAIDTAWGASQHCDCMAFEILNVCRNKWHGFYLNKRGNHMSRVNYDKLMAGLKSRIEALEAVDNKVWDQK